MAASKALFRGPPFRRGIRCRLLKKAGKAMAETNWNSRSLARLICPRSDEAEVVGNEARPEHVLQHELIASAEVDHGVGVHLRGMAENIGEARDVAEARQSDGVA